MEYYGHLDFPGGSEGKASAYSAGDLGSIPGSGRSPEKGMATHFPILAWRIPWTKEPGRIQSMRLQRVRNDWATNTFTLLFYLLWLIRWILLSSYCLCMRIFMIELLLQWLSGKEPACQCRKLKRHRFDPWVGKIPWRRTWQSTPIFLPGKIPGTEEPGGLQSIGLQRVGHDWTTLHACKPL